MIKHSTTTIPVTTKCTLLGLNRSTYYYNTKGETPENIELMRLIDEIHMANITWGSRKIRDYLRNQGWKVNRKRIQRLMSVMRIKVLFPRINLSRRNQEHKIYPYLLKNLEINRPNQVWCTDITYIRLYHGFVYLLAIMDWYSKKVLAWELSNTVDKYFCIQALETALRKHGRPEIFNSDQGCQFTSPDFIKVLKDKDSSIKISMDGKGRALDNVCVERFWRTIKYDEVYLHEYNSINEARKRIGLFINSYNSIRPHQTLGGKTPDSVYYYEIDNALSA
jgi:putative transposase